MYILVSIYVYIYIYHFRVPHSVIKTQFQCGFMEKFTATTLFIYTARTNKTSIYMIEIYIYIFRR